VFLLAVACCGLLWLAVACCGLLWLAVACCVLFRLAGLGSFDFLSSINLAGGSPAATHFLCLAKESKPRKRPLGRSPFGVPGADRHKSGRENNSLRSDIFPFFFRFDPAVTGYSQADFQTGSLRIARGR
jgi:hypothetical protein